jgi:hypothetical protein
MHSHSREAGLSRPWWIQGTISATLTMVGVDKITTKGPLQWGFNGWIFYLFIYLFIFNGVELLWQQYTVTVYVQENSLFKKVKTTIFKYQRTCLEPVKIVILFQFK